MTPQHEKNMVPGTDGHRPAAILFASRSRRTGIATLVASCALTLSAAQAQQQPQQQPQQQAQQQQALITPQFRDAEITQIIDAVGQVTGKTFIVDPRVRAQVTILSSTPMSPDAFYETFLSILQVHGFIAVPSGPAIKIVPEANLRQLPANDLPNRVSSSSDEIVTQVIPVRNVNAAQLVPILRPMVPQTGHLAAYGPSNMLIVSDHANNVSRIIRIIQRIDQASDEEIDIVRLENASAAEIVRVTNSLFAAAPGAPPEGGGGGIKLIADDRTNSVLVTGERSQRLRVKALIAHLDTPREGGGDTQVIYLNYADAETLGGKLREQVTGIVQAAGGTAAPGGGAAPPAAAGASAALADRTVNIWSEPQTNALVITAPPKAMNQLKSVISRLDIRRLQVLVEAILVEVSTNKSAELGVNWAVGSTEEGDTVPVGTFNQPVGGASIGSIVTAIRDPDTLATVGIPNGLTLGAGRINDSGVSFAVLLRALRGDASTNILQTPSIITLDNEEAEIKVAQEVPFVTGQFTNTGAAAGSVNPFQTIQREEVGTILKITPQINESQSVLLKIEQESSDIAQSTQGAVDLITNKRTITTKVLVEDGGVIVLGGLIRDSALESENRVPILGSIPLIGELFKTRSGQKEKRNLMVFIRPTILRDGTAAAIETNAKYNVIRDQQLSRRKGRVTLLPGERQPLLPPIEDLSKYADPTAGERGAPAPGTDKSRVSPVQTTPLPPTDAPPPPDIQPPQR
jgi:general secretion pathway protein D